MKSEPLTSDEKIARIRKALRYAGNYHSWEDVVLGLNEGRYQIFDNDDGALITEVMQLPRGRYVNVWIAAGRLPGIMKNVAEVEKLARSEGCRQMVAFGREGWDRVLPHYGWNKIGVVYSRDVTDA